MSLQRYVVPFTRTHRCGEVGESDVDREVRLMGWVARVRDLGGLRFIDLRDRTGIVQLIVDPREKDLDEVSRQLPEAQKLIAGPGFTEVQQDLVAGEVLLGRGEREVAEFHVLYYLADKR